LISDFHTVAFMYLPGALEAVPAGRLTLREEGGELLTTLFGYGKNYLERHNAVPVDPTDLPLQGAVPGSESHRNEPTNGLSMFGAIRDAMPDSWGRRVIENRLAVPPNSLPESEYLRLAGSNRAGALDFREEHTSPPSSGTLSKAADLQYLLSAADKIQRGEKVPENLTQIFEAGSSLGGMRPKVMVVNEGIQYIAKFPTLSDPFNIPLIERASLELARRCGLTVPRTGILELPDGRSVMLIERFDRKVQPKGWSRVHMVSALTMLGLHESESRNSSYGAISDRISHVAAIGRAGPDRRELFARMVFNILISNDDDHLRNHAFLWSEKQRGWALSPLYDVVPKPQIATQRYLHLAIGTQGRLATLDNAASEANRFGLQDDEAAHIIERISMQAREWRSVFEELNVPSAECDKIMTAFRRPSKGSLSYLR